MSLHTFLGNLWRERTLWTMLNPTECRARLLQGTSRRGIIGSLRTGKALLGDTAGDRIILERRSISIRSIINLRGKLIDANGVTKIECVTGLPRAQLIGLILVEAYIAWALIQIGRSVLFLGGRLTVLDAIMVCLGVSMFAGIAVGLLFYLVRLAKRDGDVLFQFLKDLLEADDARPPQASST